MNYEVELSEQADSDLREIFEYIAFELQSPENTSVNTTHLRTMPSLIFLLSRMAF